MDQHQKQNANQAVEQWTDSTHQAFRTMAHRTVSLQEGNLRLAQNFFHDWIERVNNQAQGTREAAQYMRDQGQRQREAVETLSQEATNAYTESLNSALGFYQQTLSTATQVAQQNIQQVAQATQQGMQAGVQAVSRAGQQAMEVTSQATRQGAQATSQAAQQGAQAANQGARGAEQIARSGAYAAQRVATGVPIRDYDDLNVGEIVEQLDNLSADELHHVRAYEQENKSRDGVLQQIDRKTMEAIGVPIKDYNSLNVGELVGRLDDLSAEELQAARAYEQENKNRDGVLQQIDRRLNAAS